MKCNMLWGHMGCWWIVDILLYLVKSWLRVEWWQVSLVLGYRRLNTRCWCWVVLRRQLKCFMILLFSTRRTLLRELVKLLLLAKEYLWALTVLTLCWIWNIKTHMLLTNNTNRSRSCLKRLHIDYFYYIQVNIIIIYMI